MPSLPGSVLSREPQVDVQQCSRSHMTFPPGQCSINMSLVQEQAGSKGARDVDVEVQANFGTVS
jgi:hypothetical protein